jgi:hypothetical protein
MQPHKPGVYLRNFNKGKNIRGRWRYLTFDEMFELDSD